MAEKISSVGMKVELWRMLTDSQTIIKASRHTDTEDSFNWWMENYCFVFESLPVDWLAQGCISVSLIQVSEKSFSFSLALLTSLKHYWIIKPHNQRNKLNPNDALPTSCPKPAEYQQRFITEILLISNVSKHSACAKTSAKFIRISKAVQSDRYFYHDYVWQAEIVCCKENRG